MASDAWDDSSPPSSTSFARQAPLNAGVSSSRSPPSRAASCMPSCPSSRSGSAQARSLLRPSLPSSGSAPPPPTATARQEDGGCTGGGAPSSSLLPKSETASRNGRGGSLPSGGLHTLLELRGRPTTPSPIPLRRGPIGAHHEQRCPSISLSHAGANYHDGRREGCALLLEHSSFCEIEISSL
jgi:hypothetical protein